MLHFCPLDCIFDKLHGLVHLFELRADPFFVILLLFFIRLSFKFVTFGNYYWIFSDYFSRMIQLHLHLVYFFIQLQMFFVLINRCNAFIGSKRFFVTAKNLFLFSDRNPILVLIIFLYLILLFNVLQRVTLLIRMKLYCFELECFCVPFVLLYFRSSRNTWYIYLFFLSYI